jgi:hypothetical protein
MWKVSWPPDRRVEQLAQPVAVPGPRVEERKDEQLGESPLQLAVERAGVDACHEQIVCRQISLVNRSRSVRKHRRHVRLDG